MWLRSGCSGDRSRHGHRWKGRRAVVENTATISLADIAARPHIDVRTHGLNLFLTGFLVLFLELACIRWFAANVIFLQFFTNVILLACFLGMSCGCMAA